MKLPVTKAVARLLLFATACSLLGALGAAAQAQTVNIAYLEGTQPVAPDAITWLGPDLFGDKVNLFNGALEFEQTDTQLPGNNALAVAISRRYSVGRSWDVRGQFGDWDLETPRIGGTFSRLGWVTTSGGVNRCSGFSAPPLVTSGAAFSESDYWQGTSITLPGQGSQEVLRRAADFPWKPTDGRVYPLVTRGNWQVDCLPSIQNGSGEGFIAITPDGVRYRFDWMATRMQTGVKKSGSSIARYDHFLMATEVSDRFGNWVRYSYEPASPLLLRRIESSDERVILVGNAGGRAVSVNHGARIVNYGYGAVGNLRTVHQPGGSRWTFNLGGMTAINLSDMGEGAYCDFPGGLPPDDLGGTMTHPSGATGTFKTRYPTGDPVAYAPTTQEFAQVLANEYGLASGHWRQTIVTARGYRYRYFDALWRVRLDRHFDADRESTTQSFVETRYDADNRKSFESYPTRTFTLADQGGAGRTTIYDRLDRVVQQSADSELGPLITRTEYQNAFKRQVNDAAGNRLDVNGNKVPANSPAAHLPVKPDPPKQKAD